MITTNVATGTELTEEERRQAAQLEHIWQGPRGFAGWFKAVHHTTIGKRYVVTAFTFFLVAGLLAGAMRLQLAFPERTSSPTTSTTRFSPCMAAP